MAAEIIDLAEYRRAREATPLSPGPFTIDAVHAEAQRTLNEIYSEMFYRLSEAEQRPVS